MNAAQVLVLWTRTEREWSAADLTRAVAAVPAHVHAHSPRYRRWQDVQMGLLGKLLLREGLRALGHDAAALAQMTWGDAGRPALPLPGDFNLSHSGGVVAAAFSRTTRLGLDIEYIHAIPIDDLARVMTAAERARIEAAPDQAAEVCRLWTFKEAVIKADGRGVGLDLQQLSSLDASADVGGVRWHVRPLAVHRSVACHLATDRAEVDLVVRECAEAALVAG